MGSGRCWRSRLLLVLVYEFALAAGMVVMVPTSTGPAQVTAHDQPTEQAQALGTTASSTTGAPATTTATTPTTSSAEAGPAPAFVPPPATPASVVPEEFGGYGCAAALAYLAVHASPEFTFVCPGSALGHSAMTCINVGAVCPGQHVIVIAEPCPNAYRNEAHNSRVWSDEAGRFLEPIDPWGPC